MEEVDGRFWVARQGREAVEALDREGCFCDEFRPDFGRGGGRAGYGCRQGGGAGEEGGEEGAGMLGEVGQDGEGEGVVVDVRGRGGDGAGGGGEPFIDYGFGFLALPQVVLAELVGDVGVDFLRGGRAAVVC